MDKDKIEKTLEYYNTKRNGIVNLMNSSNNLSVEQIIYNGEQLAILEHKLTALEVAREN